MHKRKNCCVESPTTIFWHKMFAIAGCLPYAHIDTYRHSHSSIFFHSLLALLFIYLFLFFHPFPAFFPQLFITISIVLLGLIHLPIHRNDKIIQIRNETREIEDNKFFSYCCLFSVFLSTFFCIYLPFYFIFFISFEDDGFF